MDYSRLFRDGLHLLAGNLGAFVLGLIGVFVLARILVPEQMAVYVLFFVVVNLVVQVSFGWGNPVFLRFGREEFVFTRKISNAVFTKLQLFLYASLASLVFLFLFNKQIVSYIGFSARHIYILILVIISQSFVEFISMVFRTINKVKLATYPFFVQKTLFVMGVAAILLLGLQPDIYWIFCVFLMSSLFCIVLFYPRIGLRSIISFRNAKSQIGKYLRYSLPFVLGTIGYYLFQNGDLLVIKHYLTSQDVGVYSIAYRALTPLLGVVHLVPALFLPFIIESRAKKQTHVINEYINKIPVWAAFWIIVTAVGLPILRLGFPYISPLEYSGALPSLNVLLTSSIFCVVIACYNPILTAYHLVFALGCFTLIAALINTVADIVLVPSLGIIGAAYGTTISLFLQMLLTLVFIKSREPCLWGQDSV